MKVYKEENTNGILQSITFRADEGQEDFKGEVKTWMGAHQPMTWEAFFNRLVVLEAGRITISMV